VLPPGKVQCPFQSHHGEGEMFLILDGEDELRFGAERYPLRPLDVVTCPTGGAEVAHQIINTGAVEMRYLAVSRPAALDVCEYPDSGKLLVVSDPTGGPSVRAMFRGGGDADCSPSESTMTTAIGPAPRGRGAGRPSYRPSWQARRAAMAGSASSSGTITRRSSP
jgi:hypothetical protein